jgi:hypothetical protein
MFRRQRRASRMSGHPSRSTSAARTQTLSPGSRYFWRICGGISTLGRRVTSFSRRTVGRPIGDGFFRQYLLFASERLSGVACITCIIARRWWVSASLLGKRAGRRWRERLVCFTSVDEYSSHDIDARLRLGMKRLCICVSGVPIYACGCDG